MEYITLVKLLLYMRCILQITEEKPKEEKIEKKEEVKKEEAPKPKDEDDDDDDDSDEEAVSSMNRNYTKPTFTYIGVYFLMWQHIMKGETCLDKLFLKLRIAK